MQRIWLLIVLLFSSACTTQAFAQPAPLSEADFDFGQSAAKATPPLEADSHAESDTASKNGQRAAEVAPEDFAGPSTGDGNQESKTSAEPADQQVDSLAEGGEPKLAEEPVDSVLQSAFDKAYIIDVEGPIFGQFNWYLNNRLDEAERAGADVVIIRLTTPGGSLEYSMELAKRLREIDWATTIVFVPDEAISGGAILALGADRIYMTKDALLGDAGPIMQTQPGGAFEHVPEKQLSYLTEAMHTLAESGNRPGALAEAMMDRKLVVFEDTEQATGRKVFLTEKETQDPQVRGRYQIGPQVPETGQDRFLTVDGSRAVELQLSERVFASEEELLAALAPVEIQRTELNWVDKTVFILNRPWLTGLLLIVGLIGLYIELVAPGISVAGLTAVTCFGLFFWSHFLGGTSGWLEVMLFFLGVFSIICELFVLPGFGIFGVAGIGLIAGSLIMASQDFVMPANNSEWDELRFNVLLVLGSLLGVILLFFGQLLLFDSIPGLNRFKLAAPEEQAAVEIAVTGLTSGNASSGLINLGQVGVAESDLRPSGKMIADGRLYDVLTEGDYVVAGSQVEVIRLEGNSVIVRRLAES